MRKSIAFICDDNYVMPTVVTIQSIKDSYHSDCHLDVYICTFGLSQQNCELLENLSTSVLSVIIKTCDLNAYKQYIDRINQKTHVTPTSLIKFELPNLLPDVDKLLYLDSDIIVKGDLDDLFNLNMADNYLAASPELWHNLNKYWAHEEYGLDNSFYFNSGVLLYNLCKMREDNIPVKLWQKKIENAMDASKKTMDQDTLNDVCALKTIVLPIIWNLNTAFSNKKVINLDVLNKIMKTSYSTHDELKIDARILHYVGKEDKPWKYVTANCRDFWDHSYVNAGYDIRELRRESVKHGISWYWAIVKEQCRSHGFLYALRYMYYKIKNI